MKKKILLIDDEPVLISMMGDRLTHSGYEVFKASDGVEGMKMIGEISPDLIILDIMMPNMDGYSFLREVNQTQDMPKPPVIILSARDDFQLLMEIEGVKDYLLKPYDAEVLLEKITKVFDEGKDD